ncbi:MAG TPA: ABC transporter ATP-binding protein [Chloroflexota bacterium]|nr:ABC transporter ATP-binding protein [Chloroflexota bacterium]
MRDLCVAYGDLQALWDVSLEVREGELVTVIGSNGAGKTTLLKTLAGLQRCLSGEILYGGQPIERLPAYAICQQHVALVPEGGQLFPDMTVRENLEVGSYLARARAAAGRNIERAFEIFPRLKERQRQAAGSLSGGERQMLAIARALMSEPRLLMLDEPSLGLAPVTLEHIFEVLGELRQSGLTILLVEQSVQHALELADRAYVLEGGRVVRGAPAAELRQDPEIRRHFLGL